MKKRNLFILSLAMFVAVITLSSWRLFGKQIDSDPERLELPGQCVEHAFQDKYFLGIRIQNDVPVERAVDCNTGDPLNDWYPY